MSDGQSDEVPEFAAPEAGFTSKNVDPRIVSVGIVRDRRRDRRSATHHHTDTHTEHDHHHTDIADAHGDHCGACNPEQHCSFVAAGIPVGNGTRRRVDARGLCRTRRNNAGAIGERPNRQ